MRLLLVIAAITAFGLLLGYIAALVLLAVMAMWFASVAYGVASRVGAGR